MIAEGKEKILKQEKFYILHRAKYDALSVTFSSETREDRYIKCHGKWKKKNLLIIFYPVKQFLTNKDKIKTHLGKSIDNLLLANMQYKSPSG